MTSISHLKDFLVEENEVEPYDLTIGNMYIVYFIPEELILNLKYKEYLYMYEEEEALTREELVERIGQSGAREIEMTDGPSGALFGDSLDRSDRDMKIMFASSSVRFFHFSKTIKRYYESSLKDTVSLLPSSVQHQEKKFPEEWDVMVGAFNNIFNEEEWKKIADQIYQRAIEKPECSIFKNYDTDEEALSELKEEIAYYLFGMDKGGTGIFGIMQIGAFFIMEDKTTGEKHFSVVVNWRCSFTSIEDVYDYYDEMKKKGYDISAGKFLQIELMKLMSSMLRDKTILNMMKSNMYFPDEKIENIKHITVMSCSLPSALFHHLKNGAQVMTEVQINNYRTSLFDSIDLYYQCGGDLIPIYWTETLR